MIDFNKLKSSDNVSELLQALKKANYSYREGKESGLTDKEFDLLKNRLRELDPKNKFLKVIEGASGEAKIPLPYPMYSLENVDFKELGEWLTRNNLSHDTPLIFMPKFDGISVEVTDKAFSRGDGVKGSDITHLFQQIRNGIKPFQYAGDLRGEALIKTVRFNGCKDKFCKPYKNPRNMVAGLLKFDTRVPSNDLQYVDFIPYEVLSDHNFQYKSDVLEHLGVEFGCNQMTMFKVSTYEKITEEELERLYLLFDEVYGVDGIVVEVNHIKTYKALGKETNGNPKGGRAYKGDFEQKKKTTLKEIIWQPSMTGVMSPVGILEPPVILEGGEVSRVNLYNLENIYETGLYPGAEVIMKRSKGVNPKIHKVLNPIFHFNIVLPKGTYYRAPHLYIKEGYFEKEIQVRKNLHFFKTLKVELGEPTLNAMYDLGFETPEIICKLGLTQLMEIEGIKEKTALFLQNEFINKVWQCKRADFMVASGCFEDIGITTMKSIIKYEEGYCKFDLEVQGVGPITKENFMKGYSLYEDFLVDFLVYKPIIFLDQKEMLGSKYKNQVFCFSGFRSEKLKEKIESQGGVVKSSVTSEVNHLVVKDPTKSTKKIEDAKNKGIEIIALKDIE